MPLFPKNGLRAAHNRYKFQNTKNDLELLTSNKIVTVPHAPPVRGKRQEEGAMKKWGEEGIRLYITVAVLSQMPGRISCLASPAEPNSSHRGHMLPGRDFHQLRTRAEKALALVEDSQTSLVLGITSKFFPFKHKVLLGVCQETQS